MAKLVAPCTTQFKFVLPPTVTIGFCAEKLEIMGKGVTTNCVCEGMMRSLTTRTSSVAVPDSGIENVIALVPWPAVIAPPLINQMY